MNVNLSPDVERFLREMVREGRYASEEEALNVAVRLLREQRQAVDAPALNGRDPFWGLLADEADVLDEIVADAMRQRESRPLRSPNLE